MELEEHTGRTISPELVLVDPELGARARAALPEHPWPAPVRIEPPPTRVPGSRIPGGATIWVFLIVFVLLTSGVSLVSTNDRPTFAAEGAQNDPEPTATTAPRTPPTRPPPAPQTAKPRVAKERTETGERARRGRSRTRTAPPAHGPVREGFRPARVFSWPPHAGASYYQVIFLRNGEPFYRTETNTARVRLPQGVRFTAGSYRWTVRPAVASDLGVRLAPAIVDSTFQVNGG